MKNATNDMRNLKDSILRAITRAGALTDADLLVLFGRQAPIVASNLEASGRLRRDGTKWLLARPKTDNNSNNTLETEGGKSKCQD